MYSLSRISADVLAHILRFLNFESEKCSFINFWIACKGCSNTQFLIHSAMLSINVTHTLEKKQKSTLSQYLTSVNVYLEEQAYAQFLIEQQKNCQRLKKIDIRENYDEDIKEFPDYFTKFANLEKLVTYTMKIRTSFLKKFPKLHSISLRDTDPIINDNYVPKNITRLYTQHPIDVALFNNLISLAVKITSSSANVISHINISHLHFLVDLKIVFFAVFSDIQVRKDHSKLDIVVSNANLEKITISPQVKLISDSKTYPKLTQAKIANGDYDYVGEIRSNDMFQYTYNLKHFSIKSVSRNAFYFLPYMPNLTSLSMSGDYMAISHDKFDKILTGLEKLTSLKLYQVNLHHNHPETMNKICARLSHLVCHGVTYSVFREFIQYTPKDACLENLQSLDVWIESNDWIKQMTSLVKIPKIKMRFIKKWHTMTSQKFNFIQASTYVSQVDVETFIARFDVKRCEYIGSRLEKEFDLSHFKICQEFQFDDSGHVSADIKLFTNHHHNLKQLFAHIKSTHYSPEELFEKFKLRS
jgi:hypothetical protein